jgi:GT2 family glycosyltransferase/glycosyltransferase involved in cell wall biosynthesis
VRPASNLRQRPDIPNVAAADPGAALRLSQRWCTDTSPFISILIVNWNATRITLECIRQIWANTEGVRYEIIIADNGSDPDSLLPLRDLGHGIRLLELGTNRYFGEANNIAAEAAQGQLLWLLNNDAFARPGCLRGLAASLDKEECAGAAGPLFLFPNGTVQEAGGAIDPDGFPVRALRGEAIGSRVLSSHVVDYISAAALLVRKKYYFEVGGFDLAYEPAYYEDADLCFKLRAIGHPVLFCPAAQVVHIEGTSANDDAAAAGRRKAMGDINRGKFVGRWSKFLESRSEDTLSEIVAKILPGSPHAPKSPSSGAPTAVLYTPYELTPGGGERFLLTIAAALSEDHRTTLVTPYPYSQLRLANLGRQLSIDLSRCRVATEAEFLAGPAPDCMVVLGNHVVPHIAARSRNCVFVCQFPFPADPEWLLAARERAGSYRLVLVYSEYARAHYLAEQNKYQTPAWPVEVLHPPVPQHGGDPSRKRRMILTVGRFFVGGHHKRHDLMIEAFRKLVERGGQEVEFHIAGSSMPDPQNMEYLASLLRQAGDLPITFHVNVSSDQLESLYRDAALYWHATGLDAPLATSPHEAEHFGITILEAMSAGCAPLVFNEGGPSEIVTQGVDGFLYGSLDELVDRTIELLAPEAEDYRVKIGIAAAERAIAFSQSVFHERARSLLLDIPHPPGPVDSDKILASAGSPFLHFNSVFDADEIVRRYAMRDVHPRPGYLTNYLGVSVDPKFFPQLLDGRGGQVEGLPIPGNWHADMAEFAAVLRAVDLAHDNFTIIELGCGWGCWMNNAGAAARERGLHVHLIGVEGDEGHIEFAKEACETNGFRPQEVTLYHGVAAARTGTALFPRQGQAGTSWGLQPIFGATDEQESEALRSGTHDRLPMVAMADIADPYQRIDLLHVDVQGGEVDLISGCLPVLQDKVAYLFVGSHSRQIEGMLFEVLLAAGWRLEIERPGFLKLDGACPYMWVDGAQGWRNPKLLPSDDR